MNYSTLVEKQKFKFLILMVFLTMTSNFSFAETGGSGQTYTDPSTGITHYYNESGKLVGSSFVGEYGLEVHSEEGENIYVIEGNSPSAVTGNNQTPVVPRTEYEARNRRFSAPTYVNTPIGRYKVKSVEYYSDGTLKTLDPAEKITLTIPQGKVTAFGLITFGRDNMPIKIEIPDTLYWDNQPNTIRVSSKMFFWENGFIKSFKTWDSQLKIMTPIGEFSSDRSICFHDNGMFKMFSFNGWEEIRTPAGRFMIGSVGFDEQGIATYYKFSENEPFYIGGVKYKRNCTLKISQSGQVLGYYLWDYEEMEWKPK